MTATDQHSDASAETQQFRSFAEFYPYYLSEHQDPTCRRLHYLASVLVLLCTAIFIALGLYAWLLAIPVIGYGPAWIGHYCFERNQPATFKHPLYSLMGDWVMLRDALTGRIPF